VEIKGFPTILFFPNGKKDSPMKYEGPREVNNFIDFLKEHSTKAFEVEKDAEPAAEEEEEEGEAKDEL
jgi:hypothetical protein